MTEVSRGEISEAAETGHALRPEEASAAAAAAISCAIREAIAERGPSHLQEIPLEDLRAYVGIIEASALDLRGELDRRVALAGDAE